MKSEGGEKTVAVTGGGKGIGESITRVFCNNGYRVGILSRTHSGLTDELGDRARFFEADVRSPSSIETALAQLVEWAGGLDVMVNNAGYSGWRSVQEVDEEFWSEMIDTNLKGVFFGCQAAATRLKHGGSIVNVSSLAGKRGSANNSVYCASKFGVNGVTQSLAKELGSLGIRVNAVCPVYVETEGLLGALDSPKAPPGGQDVRVYLDGFAASNSALGVLPKGEEVAEACLFLASDGASAITGQCINVDCGVLPQ